MQAKVADATMAASMQLWAAMGHPCAPDFKADDFLTAHPEYDWTRGLLQDMKTQPWTQFGRDEVEAVGERRQLTYVGQLHTAY